MNAYLLGACAVATVGYRFVAALTRRRRLERAKALFEAYTAATNEPDPGLSELLERDAAVVARTIRAAPVDPARLSYFDSTDRYPFFADGDIGVLENFLAPRTLIRREYLVLLEGAIRYHRRLEREAIDPRTWLRWILFLPRDWLDYLGWRTVRTRMFVTAVQLLYWLIPVAFLARFAWQRFDLGRLLPF